MDPCVIIPLEITKPIMFCTNSGQKTHYNCWDYNGEKKFCFSEFVATNLKNMVKSTVGHMGKNIIDENARRSHTIENVKIAFVLSLGFHKKIDEQIKKIIPVYFRNHRFYS